MNPSEPKKTFNKRGRPSGPEAMGHRPWTIAEKREEGSSSGATSSSQREVLDPFTVESTSTASHPHRAQKLGPEMYQPNWHNGSRVVKWWLAPQQRKKPERVTFAPETSFKTSFRFASPARGELIDQSERYWVDGLKLYVPKILEFNWLDLDVVPPTVFDESASFRRRQLLEEEAIVASRRPQEKHSVPAEAPEKVPESDEIIVISGSAGPSQPPTRSSRPAVKSSRARLGIVHPFLTVLRLDYRSASQLPMFFVKNANDVKKYNEASHAQRKEMLTARARIVAYEEMDKLHESFARTHYQLSKMTTVNFNQKPGWGQEIKAKRVKLARADFQSRRRTRSQHQAEGANETLATFVSPPWLEDYKNLRYVPPQKRVLIFENITFNLRDVIPVFSDIASEIDDIQRLDIPKTLLYSYAERNRVHTSTEPLLASILKDAEEQENIISCGCHSTTSTEKFVPCWENKNCKCYQMNLKLQSLQTGKEPCEFKTFGPIKTTEAKDTFFVNIGFACSERCGCAGNCTNNAVYLPEKRVFPLEIYREDPNIGFALRSMAYIPAGMPFIEYTGQVDGKPNLSEKVYDYCYQISYESNEDIEWQNKLKAMRCFPKAFHKKLIEANKMEYHINPKTYGNAARTVSHSCLANTELLRVYQKCFSPAHVRLLMVSSEDIFPGEPICFDYGKEYVKNQLQDCCGCKTFACHQQPHCDELDTFSDTKIALCLGHQFKSRFTDFQGIAQKAAQKSFQFPAEDKLLEKLEQEAIERHANLGPAIMLEEEEDGHGRANLDNQVNEVLEPQPESSRSQAGAKPESSRSQAGAEPKPSRH